MKKNPNATVAAITFAASEVVTYIAKHFAHTTLSDYWAQALTGGLVWVVLMIGRDGVKGAALRLLSGSKAVWNGSATDTSVKK